MPLQDFSVERKQVVVIGGGRGIGRGIALTLAEARADVAVAALTAAKVFDVAERAAAFGVKAKGVPLGRPGPLRDVGLMAVYLASDAGAYITGQTFLIDGGASVL